MKKSVIKKLIIVCVVVVILFIAKCWIDAYIEENIKTISNPPKWPISTSETNEENIQINEDESSESMSMDK